MGLRLKRGKPVKGWDLRGLFNTYGLAKEDGRPDPRCEVVKTFLERDYHEACSYLRKRPGKARITIHIYMEDGVMILQAVKRLKKSQLEAHERALG